MSPVGKQRGKGKEIEKGIQREGQRRCDESVFGRVLDIEWGSE